MTARGTFYAGIIIAAGILGAGWLVADAVRAGASVTAVPVTGGFVVLDPTRNRLNFCHTGGIVEPFTVECRAFRLRDASPID